MGVSRAGVLPFGALAARTTAAPLLKSNGTSIGAMGRGLLRRSLIGAITSLMPSVAAAQHYQTDFPPEEFKARWAKVYDAIGAEAVAVAQGAPLTNGFQLPRQSNTFYYLSGIETPGSYLVLDGRSRRATLYLPPRNERLERSEGKVLSADDAQQVKTLTGADDVRSTATMADGWPLGGAPAAAIYVESAPAEGHAQSRGELRAADAAIAADGWDGALPRHS